MSTTEKNEYVLGRSKYADDRQVYLNKIIAENLGLVAGKDEVEFIPSDSPQEVRVRKRLRRYPGEAPLT